ncbi:MAG TPA: hypothetical protein VFZ53_34130 [Polyangiaceae bacterium]
MRSAAVRLRPRVESAFDEIRRELGRNGTRAITLNRVADAALVP